MISVVFLWFALAIVVGVAANTRGRTGLAWFLLSIFLSPLIAGLLVLALPRIDHDAPLARERGKEPFEDLPSWGRPTSRERMSRAVTRAFTVFPGTTMFLIVFVFLFFAFFGRK